VIVGPSLAGVPARAHGRAAAAYTARDAMKIARLVLLVFAFAASAAGAAIDDDAAFQRWVKANPDIGGFEKYLQGAGLGGVVPTRQLLRTASDWRRCLGPQFDIPPPEQWPDVAQVLRLVVELKERKILRDFEVASAYRNPPLNKCAHGAPKSSHTASFAIDILPLGRGGVDELALCGFWVAEGSRWNMGLSRYPSGRIHLDTSGWRTWGADHSRRSTFCALPRAATSTKRPAVKGSDRPAQ
jgi:hypothetical protein